MNQFLAVFYIISLKDRQNVVTYFKNKGKKGKRVEIEENIGNLGEISEIEENSENRGKWVPCISSFRSHSEQSLGRLTAASGSQMGFQDRAGHCPLRGTEGGHG